MKLSHFLGLFAVAIFVCTFIICVEVGIKIAKDEPISSLFETKPPVMYRLDIGVINSIRIDDDAEYHINTDAYSYNDINQHETNRDYTTSVKIERANTNIPHLYRQLKDNQSHHLIAVLPYDYQIETFED